MSGMYRIICSKLLVLIRLAIVVSLAGYSLSNASAAMHGGSDLSARSSMSMADHHQGADASHDHHDQASADADGTDGMKTVKQECCQDFCVSFVLVVSADALEGPVVSTVSGFLNDRGLLGQNPALHRPPNI